MAQICETPAVRRIRGSERYHRSEQRDGPERTSDLEYVQDEGLSCSIGPMAAAISADPIFRRRVESLCRLPRLIAELLAELAAEHGLRSAVSRKLERYCGLPANVLTVTGGDRFSPMPLYVARPVTGAAMSGAARRPAPRRP